MSKSTVELLDQLDALRAAATIKFPLRQDSGWGEDVLSADGVQFGVSGEPADAALIVAAVNAVPRLVAALRGVLARLDFADGTGQVVHGTADGGAVWARDIRSTIAAALTDGTPR